MSEYQVTPEQEKKWREEFENWFTKNQGEAYDSMWVFARDAYLFARAIDAQRIAELEAQIEKCVDSGNALLDRLSPSGFSHVKPISHAERDMVGHIELLRNAKRDLAKRKGE